jgi:hypothetical protein
MTNGNEQRVNRIVRREAAWERYRDTIAMRRVMNDPEPGDVRLAFEAGYAAALQESEPLEVREGRISEGA